MQRDVAEDRVGRVEFRDVTASMRATWQLRPMDAPKRPKPVEI